MWVFTEDGFYSAVRETRGAHKGEMVVRGRSKEDLERFVAKYGDGNASEIHTTGRGEHTDYGYRFWMTPQDFGASLAKVAEAVEYTNFKSRVVVTLGRKREHMLHSVWSVMAKLQPGGAYGVGGYRQSSRSRRDSWDSEIGDWADPDDGRADADADEFVQQRLTEAFDAGTVTVVRGYQRGGEQVSGYTTKRRKRGRK